jgi:hypothetical protein
VDLSVACPFVNQVRRNVPEVRVPALHKACALLLPEELRNPALHFAHDPASQSCSVPVNLALHQDFRNVARNELP